MITKTNKQVQAIAVFLVTFVIFAVTILLARHIFIQIETGINEVGNDQADQVFEDMDVAFSAFDSAILMIIVGLTIVLLFTSFMIPTHPIFLVINIVGLIVLVFMAGIVANVYGNIIDNPDIQQSLLVNQSCVGGGCEYHLTKTTFIMTKLPWLCAIIITISTILMYAKGRDY